MPELPEVETVRRGLEPVIVGKVIVDASVNRPDLRWPFPENMADQLTGAKVNALRRRSNYLLADLSSRETLIIHLGMSGRMLVSGASIGGFYHEHAAPQKHDHVVLELEGVAAPRSMEFCELEIRGVAPGVSEDFGPPSFEFIPAPEGEEDSIVGRAGMRYRDLLPGRQGGP